MVEGTMGQARDAQDEGVQVEIGNKGRAESLQF